MEKKGKWDRFVRIRKPYLPCVHTYIHAGDDNINCADVMTAIGNSIEFANAFDYLSEFYLRTKLL